MASAVVSESRAELTAELKRYSLGLLAIIVNENDVAFVRKKLELVSGINIFFLLFALRNVSKQH